MKSSCPSIIPVDNCAPLINSASKIFVETIAVNTSDAPVEFEDDGWEHQHSKRYKNSTGVQPVGRDSPAITRTSASRKLPVVGCNKSVSTF